VRSLLPRTRPVSMGSTLRSAKRAGEDSEVTLT
jgi:hypothetical protein